MAIADKPNSTYCINSLLADLKRITVGNSFWTELKSVEMPNYGPDDGMVLQGDAPKLLVWVTGMGPTQSRVGQYRRVINVMIYGIVKQDEAVQEATMRLAEDVRSILLFNPQRNFPGLTAVINTWGTYTAEEVEGFRLLIDKDENAIPFGQFTSRWRITHEFPAPHG